MSKFNVLLDTWQLTREPVFHSINGIGSENRTYIKCDRNAQNWPWLWKTQKHWKYV